MKENDNIKLLSKFLDGNSNKEEMRQLNRSLDNPSQFDDWMTEQWEEADNEIDFRIEKKMYTFIDAQRKKGSDNFKPYFWQIAASLLLISTIGLSYLLYDRALFADSDPSLWSVNVEKGQKANMTLPDGTRVWINSDSKITYNSDFNRSSRDVKLEGEAYFEVAKNEKLPFIVQTSLVDVQALGTAFNVKAYANDTDVETTLVEGKVLVNTPLQSKCLLPNQRMIFGKHDNSVSIEPEADAQAYAAWRTNQLMFNHQDLKSITKVLERYYNIKFVFEEEKLETYCFSGAIPNTSLESLLEIIAMTSPMSYHMKDSTIYLKTNKHADKYFDAILKSAN